MIWRKLCLLRFSIVSDFETCFLSFSFYQILEFVQHNFGILADSTMLSLDYWPHCLWALSLSYLYIQTMTHLHLIEDSASELIVGGWGSSTPSSSQFILGLNFTSLVQTYSVSQGNVATNAVTLFPGSKGDSLLATTIANTQSNLVAFGVWIADYQLLNAQ